MQEKLEKPILSTKDTQSRYLLHFFTESPMKICAENIIYEFICFLSHVNF